MSSILSQTPEAAEIAEQTRRRRAAVLLQRWWRRRRFQMAAEQERRAVADGQRAERSQSWLCVPKPWLKPFPDAPRQTGGLGQPHIS